MQSRMLIRKNVNTHLCQRGFVLIFILAVSEISHEQLFNIHNHMNMNVLRKLAQLCRPLIDSILKIKEWRPVSVYMSFLIQARHCHINSSFWNENINRFLIIFPNYFRYQNYPHEGTILHTFWPVTVSQVTLKIPFVYCWRLRVNLYSVFSNQSHNLSGTPVNLDILTGNLVIFGDI